MLFYFYTPRQLRTELDEGTVQKSYNYVIFTFISYRSFSCNYITLQQDIIQFYSLDHFHWRVILSYQHISLIYRFYVKV